MWVVPHHGFQGLRLLVKRFCFVRELLGNELEDRVEHLQEIRLPRRRFFEVQPDLELWLPLFDSRLSSRLDLVDHRDRADMSSSSFLDKVVGHHFAQGELFLLASMREAYSLVQRLCKSARQGFCNFWTASRISGLALLETSVTRRLAITDRKISIRILHIVPPPNDSYRLMRSAI